MACELLGGKEKEERKRERKEQAPGPIEFFRRNKACAAKKRKKDLRRYQNLAPG
jgi:hypothetical protein